MVPTLVENSKFFCVLVDIDGVHGTISDAVCVDCRGAFQTVLDLKCCVTD